jgi:hypothetical protein
MLNSNLHTCFQILFSAAINKEEELLDVEPLDVEPILQKKKLSEIEVIVLKKINK